MVIMFPFAAVIGPAVIPPEFKHMSTEDGDKTADGTEGTTSEDFGPALPPGFTAKPTVIGPALPPGE